MNLESLEAAWGSAANGLSPELAERLTKDLVEELRRRARRRIALLSLSGTVLLAMSALFVQRLTTGGIADWELAPLLAPPWLAFALVLRQLLRQRAKHPDSGRSILAALRSAESEARGSRARVHRIALLHLVSLPALALGLASLVDSGRVRPHELVSLATVLGILVAGSGVGLALYDRLHLRPLELRLRSLIESYA